MRTKYICVLALLAALSAGSTAVSSTASSLHASNFFAISKTANSEPQAENKRLLAYETALWTDDDRPYAEIRTNLDRIYTEHRLTRQLYNSIESAYIASPSNMLKLFAYNYATLYMLRHTAPDDLAMQDKRYLVGNAVTLGHIHWPKTHNCARLLYLSIGYVGPSPDLLAFGKRLLDYDPGDYEVEFLLADTLNWSLSQPDRRQALAYAEDIVKHYPTLSSSYSLLAHMYNVTWIRDKDKQAGIMARNEYQKSLSLLPRNSPYYDSIQKQIDTLPAS